MGSQSATAAPVAFQIHSDDNVATLLTPAHAGPVVVRGSAGERSITARQAIQHGHKIAVAKIGQGESIVKFGVVIGVATCAISEGDWVHLHNCGSRLDERSNAFDVRTGVPEDVSYE
jgi:altronate dehydratase small subunit